CRSSSARTTSGGSSPPSCALSARPSRTTAAERSSACATRWRARKGCSRTSASWRMHQPLWSTPSGRSSSATVASWPRATDRNMTAVEWLDAMSPWPRDGFGLDRMRALLAVLGDPQLAYPAIHVVGTNGKSTATVTIEQLLLAEGLSVGSTISPHVVGWSERIRVNGEEADFEAAVARVRTEAGRAEATQFEIVTAAALAAFAAAGVDVAVVEAGLGGRHDATNVLRTRVVLLTNVGLEHTDVLGDNLEAIATEKLAVAPPDAIVVLPDDRYAYLVEGRELVHGGARDAADAFVGHPIAPPPH